MESFITIANELSALSVLQAATTAFIRAVGGEDHLAGQFELVLEEMFTKMDFSAESVCTEDVSKQISTPFDISIRRMLPDEAAAVSKLAYFAYNYSYTYGYMYDPEQVRSLPDWVYGDDKDRIPFTRGTIQMDKQDIETAMRMFYEEAGWDKETGSPTRETYRRLGLASVAGELDKKGLIA